MSLYCREPWDALSHKGRPEGHSLPGPADHDLPQGVQHLPLIVFEVTVDLAHTLLLHHPQLAVGFRDESCIMADNDHGLEEMSRNRAESKEEGDQDPKGRALPSDALVHSLGANLPPLYSLMASPSASMDSMSKLLVGSSCGGGRGRMRGRKRRT